MLADGPASTEPRVGRLKAPEQTLELSNNQGDSGPWILFGLVRVNMDHWPLDRVYMV
jgi:hypothetical protein